MFDSVSYFMDVGANKMEEERHEISLIAGALRDSLWLEASASSDLIGPSMDGIGKLLRMPYGCGEQTMLNFAPNTYIISYLKHRALLEQNARVKQQGEAMMKSGYQRELGYRHDDGSFSAFGNRDTSGSLWLTAFVLKCFMQARELTYIDPAVTRRAASWLLEQRISGGSFKEPGRVLHAGMQGGSTSSQIALNAYVLTALVENDDSKSPEGEFYALRFNNGQRSALLQVLGSLESAVSSHIKASPYQLSVVAYAAICLAAHSKFPNSEQLRAFRLSQRARAKLMSLKTGNTYFS